MKLLEIESEQEIQNKKQTEDKKQKEDNMYKAIFFMLIVSICAVSNSTIFKSAKRHDGANVVDYFYVRNSLSLVVYGLVNYFQKIDPWDFPQSKSRREWYSIFFQRSVYGHGTFFLA